MQRASSAPGDKERNTRDFAERFVAYSLSGVPEKAISCSFYHLGMSKKKPAQRAGLNPIQGELEETVHIIVQRNIPVCFLMVIVDIHYKNIWLQKKKTRLARPSGFLSLSSSWLGFFGTARR